MTTTTTYETTPTTTDTQTIQMTTDELTTESIEATTQEHSGDSETTALRTTEPSNEYPTTASQYTTMKSSVGIVTTQYESFTTERETSDTTMASHSTTTTKDRTTNSDSTLPTHQPRTAGLSLAIIISLACAAAFILIILIVLCVFCCSERRRKTGKWIPQRRKERTPVRVSQMYYDVPLDGVVESVCESNSNRNLKISGFDSFSATAPSAVDSGIDDNHSTTSTRRTNHSPSLSIGSKSNQSDDEFPAPPSPLTNQNTSV
uniref:Uncharacterized protein n=1 Tax=Ciona savignyi TaxID=51511 RepID=H2YF18_CIOSA